MPLTERSHPRQKNKATHLGKRQRNQLQQFALPHSQEHATLTTQSTGISRNIFTNNSGNKREGMKLYNPGGQDSRRVSKCSNATKSSTQNNHPEEQINLFLGHDISKTPR
ncbi:hypothetical protein MLD38_021356 [Melastoma candidum]|uniref:Uncharacterized protein n=1 Tax=Melastoma candidum TaxID=119954 RepID=A0ACB9QFX1_9MYRT|nr:hypothetical protein MLD38_021356 [Melastoma candidum]